MAVFGWLWLCLSLPSWSALESKLPSTLPPVFEGKLPDPSIANAKPVLYRDKDAICPYSQQVWLALEAKGIDYATVLLPSSSTSSLKLTWPDGTEQTESLEILEKIQKEYPNQEPNLYPKGISECVDSVRCNIVRFNGVFPRRTNPTIHAPYLLKQDTASLVPNSQHMVTLEETDEVLEEYYQGPYLCGKDFTAADIVWAPFLERYAVQLPCMNPGLPELDPRGGGEYPALREWFEAMEANVACYSCRVQGNIPFYRAVLEKGIQQYNQENDASIELSDENPVFPEHEVDGEALWKQYAKDRPWLAETPEDECTLYMIRNRQDIISDASKELSLDEDDADTALREVIGALLDNKDNGGDKLSGNARDVATFVSDRVSVPRDMGMVPAATLQRIVEMAPAPRIA